MLACKENVGTSLSGDELTSLLSNAPETSHLPTTLTLQHNLSITKLAWPTECHPLSKGLRVMQG